jgi:hypothetical protein
LDLGQTVTRVLWLGPMAAPDRKHGRKLGCLAVVHDVWMSLPVALAIHSGEYVQDDKFIHRTDRSRKAIFF